MKEQEVINLISNRVILNPMQEFKICEIEDFPQYIYINVVDKDTKRSTGGHAYVISLEEDKKIFIVPNEMPPHFNLRSVMDGDAEEMEQTDS